jgi:hypothetical protein
MTIPEAPPKEDRTAVDPATEDDSLQIIVRGSPVGEVLPPPFPPTSHSRPTARRRRSVHIALSRLLILALIVGVVLMVSRLAAPTSVPTAVPARSVLASLRTAGGGSLVIRTPAGGIAYVAMTGKRLLTHDNQQLALTSIRLGDTLSMPSATEVVDGAQLPVSMQGITALNPDPGGEVMTIQVSPTRTIPVDIGSHTRINGTLPSVGSRMSILDLNPVRVVGILDTTLDEVTQT